MIIIDKTILTKNNIRSIAIEKDFPEPGDRVLLIDLKEPVQILEDTYVYEMLQDLGDIRNREHVVYTSHLIFNSTEVPHLDKIIARLEAYLAPAENQT